MQEGCLALAPGRRPPPMGGAGPGVVRRETGAGGPGEAALTAASRTPRGVKQQSDLRRWPL